MLCVQRIHCEDRSIHETTPRLSAHQTFCQPTSPHTVGDRPFESILSATTVFCRHRAVARRVAALTPPEGAMLLFTRHPAQPRVRCTHEVVRLHASFSS